MKSALISIIIVAFSGLLSVTNPTMDSYEQFVHQQIIQEATKQDNLSQALGVLFGGSLAHLLANTTIRHDYLLLSVYDTEFGNDHLRALGILNHFIVLETPISRKARGLTLNPHDVPSPLIGKPAPEFLLPQVQDANQQFGRKDLLGKVTLLNVWASWSVACRQEHPLLVQLARSGQVDIYGLNYKDTREDALRWLNQLGNPYKVSAFDQEGKVGIDYGVYGVPETYVIDKQGIIRYKLIGPVTPENLNKEILPLIKELQG